MYPLILIFSLILSFFYINEKSIKTNASLFAYFFFFVSTVFIVGTRYASVDYFAYIEVYERVDFTYIGFPFYSAPGGTTGNEFLFATVTSAFRYLDLDPATWFMFIAFSSIFIKFYVYAKYSSQVWLAVYLFIALMLFKELGQIRNALASSFVLLSVIFAVKRRPLFYLACFSAAFLVQAFSIVALPLYVLINNRVKPVRLLKLALVIALMSPLVGGITHHIITLLTGQSGAMISRLMSYYSQDEPYGLGGLGILYLTVGLIALIFSNRFVHDRYLFAYGLSAYFLFSDVATIGMRASDMFVINSLPMILCLMTSKFFGYQRFIPYFFAVAFGALYFVFSLGFPEPYQSILFEGR